MKGKLKIEDVIDDICPNCNSDLRSPDNSRSRWNCIKCRYFFEIHGDTGEEYVTWRDASYE